jgi:hypothetical protein
MTTCSVCGTLINFSADVHQRGELLRLGTPAHLLEVLERVMINECEAELEVRQCKVTVLHGHTKKCTATRCSAWPHIHSHTK